MQLRATRKNNIYGGNAMPCTTILVGKNASYNGSTLIARNDDSGSGHFTAKKFVVVEAKDQPRHYKSVISHVEVELPDDPMRYTATPNATKDEGGIWAAAGVNEENISMTATETITSNERVLGADPLVELVEAVKDADDKEITPEKDGGIGEEDIVILVLPYIHSAREGVIRLGSLLEKYGTYEMNGIAFADVNEVWWLETIGGHHWIARRVEDDHYVVMPNQFGMDRFDMNDAYGDQKENLCSADLRDFIEKNHLELAIGDNEGWINPRDIFGSHSDADHVYNTPRAWFMERYLNPREYMWDGEDADYTPESDDIPWTLEPEKKITVEDVKYVLSSHYQGTEFDPYSTTGDASKHGKYRSIGVNRTSFLSLTEIRPDVPKDYRAIEWIAFGSNVFNAFVPFYTNVSGMPEYMSCTTGQVSTDSFYWANRLIGVLADASYKKSINHIERYQENVQKKGREIIAKYDAKQEAAGVGDREVLRMKANQEIADMIRKETDYTLDKVLLESSNQMKNQYSRSDA